MCCRKVLSHSLSVSLLIKNRCVTNKTVSVNCKFSQLEPTQSTGSDGSDGGDGGGGGGGCTLYNIQR